MAMTCCSRNIAKLSDLDPAKIVAVAEDRSPLSAQGGRAKDTSFTVSYFTAGFRDEGRQETLRISGTFNDGRSDIQSVDYAEDVYEGFP
jgi:hypothetical protein